MARSSSARSGPPPITSQRTSTPAPATPRSRDQERDPLVRLQLRDGEQARGPVAPGYAPSGRLA